MVLVLLFLVAILSLNIPFVQTQLAQRAMTYINTELGTNIKIDRISITFDFKVNAKGVYIADHHQDTLIASESLKTSLVNIPGIVEGNNIDFGNVTAQNLTFRLKRYIGDDKDSFGIFLDKLENESPKEIPPRISFSHINAIDSQFSFVDFQGKYPDIVDLDSLNVDVSNFVIQGADLTVDINRITAQERRGVKIENLSTVFKLRDDAMKFDAFSLTTAHSRIKGQIHFLYKDTMRDFENTVRVEADFVEAQVSTTDLKKFYSPFGNHQVLNFQGRMRGVLNDFEFRDFTLNGMSHTAIDGQLHIQHIFGEGRFNLEGDFRNLETNYSDLVHLLPGHLIQSLPEYLERLGNPKLVGKVSTSGGDRVGVKAKILSEMGLADLDVELTNLTQKGSELYTGDLAFEDFDFGRLLDNPQVGKADFKFKVDGKGFTREEVNTHVEGKFSKLEYKGYEYQDIQVNGELHTPIFIGQVVSLDPNFQMSFDGMADVSGHKNNYDFKARVEYVDLYKTHFIKKDSTVTFKGGVNMKMEGQNLDDVVGTIQLEDASYTNRKGRYTFDKLSINSSFNGVVRRITVNSPDIVNGKFEGYFLLKQVPDLVKNAVGSLYSNYKPVEIEQNQYLNFDVVIHNKVVEALFPDISLSPNTTFMGSVRSSNSTIKIDFDSPEISILNAKFKNVDVKIDNSNPDSNTFVNVDEFVSEAYRMSALKLTSKREKDTLFIDTKMIGGKEDKDKFDIRLFHTVNKDNAFVVGLLPSQLHFKDRDWYLNREHKRQEIVFDDDFERIKTDTLTLEYAQQKIAFVGSRYNNYNRDYQLSFSDIDLGKIIPYIDDMDFEGVVNGGIEINQKNGIYYPGSDLRVKDLQVNDLSYGDLDLDIIGNQSLTSYSVKALLRDEKNKYLEAEGRINVDREHPVIDVDLGLNGFNVALLNAFGKDVITDIRGVATGQAKINGSLRKPSVDGVLKLNDSGLKIPYLNVDLAFEENAIVKLRNQEFYFDQVEFEDTQYHTTGQIDGTITHHNFRDWEMDLDLSAPERLLVLDTQYSEDALYYGTAFISGKARFHGPFDELVIDATASSEKGTQFIIPLSDAESIASNNYIYFLTADDKEAKEEGKGIFIKPLKGLELNFDLNVNDKAAIEIVVDQKTGSKLKGRGAGTLVMDINTNGRFNMWGEFRVKEGIYDFRYAGLVEKEFKVESGGTVVWDGNPLQANLNVRAVYRAEANPASLLENPTINRNIPIEVYIDLSGLLSNIDVNFELEYPNLSSVVKSELQYRISDRKNTELQALSLITQNSFYNETGPGNTAHPENILLERATGIFNDILSSDDDVFQVGVDYTKGNRTPDQDISDRVGVTLSTNVSDRILINGKVGVPLGGLTRSVVVGDLEVEILLNESGTLRAKIFNRESDIQYIGEELGYTQGIGLSYSVDFDTFKEMIHRILNKEVTLDQLKKGASEGERPSIVPDYIKFP